MTPVDFLNPEILLKYLMFTGTIILFFLVFFAIVSVVFYLPGLLIECIIRYILLSVVLYKIAKKKGYARPWFAFIPFLRIYLQNILPEGSAKFIFRFKDRNTMAIILTIAESILDLLPLKGVFDFVSGILLAVLYIKRMYEFVKMLDEENAVAFTILAFILGTLAPVYTLILWAEYLAMNKTDEKNE